MNKSRRVFLKAGLVSTVSVASRSLLGDESRDKDSRRDKLAQRLKGQIGITTSSVSSQLAGRAIGIKFSLLELPRIMRDELDMKVIDLNTSSLASTKGAYLDQVRAAADKAGCILTNLKLNQRGLDMNSRDRNVRQKAIATYKKSIDVAQRLGLQWVRPLPLKEKPDWDLHVASYRELADYAAERDVQMLVENFGCMQSDPKSVVKLVRAIGHNVAACPDTGNWDSNEIRYQGLAETFPIAVTCDFKARQLGPNGEHPLYDLKRCFAIGRKAGFQGPWCLEHANSKTKDLFREFVLLREQLRTLQKDT